MPNWKKVIVSGSNAHLNEITSSTFLVDGNQSGNFIAVIDNDQNSNGHVLKLASDGTGNGSYILDMENGTNTMFRARADGRFAFGNSAVTSMGAGTFVVGIDGGHTSDIAISKRLQHLGDGDTYIDFESNKIILSAGGNLLDYTTTKFSGSAATTASFGRLEVTTISASRVDVDAGTLAIGGTSITKTVADNIQDTSGTNTGDITLAGGSKDFIQLTNQVVTVNQVDLTDDVTGVLPSANLDSDTAHLTTTQTFSGIKTFSAPITASAGVSGSASSTGSFGKMVVGSTALANSGSTLFEIKGQQGTLFNVTDEMSGSIFSANTIAGIPVIEAFSDQTVRLGPLDNQVEVGLGGHITSSANISSSATLIGANISSSGDIVADGDVVAYNSSDMRLKNNLKVIEGALDKIDGIAGYEFDWNDNSPGWARERGHDVGVVAQEIEKIHPEIVEERKNGYLGVDYKRLVPLLIQSIKELKQEVEELKKKV